MELPVLVIVGHVCYRGEIKAKADEKETIVYGDIGKVLKLVQKFLVITNADTSIILLMIIPFQYSSCLVNKE